MREHEDGLDYTEHCLHQLGDFTSAYGVEVKWHQNSEGVEHWTLSLKSARSVAWLALRAGSYGAGDSLRAAIEDACTTYTTASQGLERASSMVLARDASSRLRGKVSCFRCGGSGVDPEHVGHCGECTP